MAKFVHNNLAEGELNAGITAVALSIVLKSGEGAAFPNPGAGEQFKIRIDDEIILIDSRSTDTLTVNASGRGHDGTTAAVHSADASVILVASAEDFLTRLLGYPIAEPGATEDALAIVWDDTAKEFDYATAGGGGGGGGGGGPWEFVKQTVLASSSTQVTFTDADWGADAEDLLLVAVGRTDRAATAGDGFDIQFGATGSLDTGSNYVWQAQRDGTASTDTGSTGDTAIKSTDSAPFVSSATGDADSFGHAEILIPAVASADIEQIVNWWGGRISTTANRITGQGTGRWDNKSVIDILGIAPRDGTNFLAGSRFTLYKRRAAAGQDPPDWIKRLAGRSDTADAFDDEFDDDDASGWTLVQPSGTITVTEKRGLLSIKGNGQSSADMAGVMKAETPSIGDVYELAIHSAFADQGGSGYVMGGIIFSDGTATSSNIAILMVWISDTSSGSIIIEQRSGTFAAVGGASNTTYAKHIHLGKLYVRLEYDAANTFRMFVSTDGVSWIDCGTVSVTLTPTHVGMGFSVWGDTPTDTDRLFAYEYIRKNPT